MRHSKKKGDQPPLGEQDVMGSEDDFAPGGSDGAQTQGAPFDGSSDADRPGAAVSDTSVGDPGSRGLDDLTTERDKYLRLAAEYDNYRKGFELIYKQLLENLTKLGVERIDPVGKSFDPHLHQAVDRAETKDHADGAILQVFQPGYVFHGRVLRPAMVRVAVHPNPASKEAAN